MRRIATSFPPPLQAELRDLLRPQEPSAPARAAEEEIVIDDFIVEPVKPTIEPLVEKQPRKQRAPRKVKLDNSRIIYLHGLESTSQSGKARQFAEKFPGMITPDFTGSFEERMKQLKPILGRKKNWTIIGSSFGGLMGATFTLDHPTQVRKLVLLAPALILEPFASRLLTPVSVPTIIVHGTEDDIVPLEPVRELAKRSFTFLTYHEVEDGHRLQKAFEELNWEDILA
jgi:pimeloyl-ACP methyl ester carboxylesterase